MFGYKKLTDGEIIQNILWAKKSEADECDETGNDEAKVNHAGVKTMLSSPLIVLRGRRAIPL